MRFSQLSAIAACVVASSAFLLPPEISDADIDIIKTLPFEDAVGVDNRIVELRCPGCPVISNIEGKIHSAQVESMLQLNFSLEHDDDADKLVLNGMQIYPLDPRSSTFMEPLTASQMVKAEDDTWTYSSTPKLGYSLSISNPGAAYDNEHLNIVSIHIEIVEVAGKFLSGLPAVDLKLVETPSHKLMIGAAMITPPKSQVSKPTDDGQECTTIVCKWRAIIADRLAKMKSGMKKGGCSKGKGQPAVVEVAPEPKHHGHHGGHHDRPHGHGAGGPHRPYRHHHRHGGFSRFLRGVVMHVFIPVLIGIMVGITASLIGMVVGHIAIFLWRITFRRGQRAQCGKYAKVEQVEAEEDVEDVENEEVKSFLQNQGPPPEYEVVVKEEKVDEV